MPLTSNRRQDYDHGLWQLGETFPAFLETSPALAVEALIAAVSAHIENKKLEEEPEQQFQFNGATARIKSDGSYIWDAHTQYRHDAHLRMLDAFEAELNRVANDQTFAQAENQILSAVTEKNNLASLWRKVLSCGARNPAGFGKKVVDLAFSLPILTAFETSSLAGDFIRAIYPEISVQERERIENAILSIPSAAGANGRDAALSIRNRLLGCIPAHLAFVDEAKIVIAQLNAQGGAPPNRPPYQIGASFGGAYTETQFLVDQGVPIQDEPNRRIIELTKPVKAFVAAHSQVAPEVAAIEGVIAEARTLHAALLNASAQGAHEKQIENGWDNLIACCKTAARCETLDCNTDTGQFIRQVLLDGARHPSPVPNERWAAEFDNHVSWSPSPRINAAEGLMFLAFNPACINAAVVQEIARLSKDAVPAVRLQIADHLGLLGKTSLESLRELLPEMAERDPSSSVVLSLLNGESTDEHRDTRTKPNA